MKETVLIVGKNNGGLLVKAMSVQDHKLDGEYFFNTAEDFTTWISENVMREGLRYEQIGK